MGRLHFITTNQNLTIYEIDELAVDLNEALKENGCPNDRVIVLRHMTWQGSVEIEEPS